MNQKAREIGMKHTNFVNSTGLHDPKHVSTAEDLEILLRYALKNPRFRKVFETMQYRTEPTQKHPEGLLLQSTLTDYKDQLKPTNGSFSAERPAIQKKQDSAWQAGQYTRKEVYTGDCGCQRRPSDKTVSRAGRRIYISRIIGSLNGYSPASL